MLAKVHPNLAQLLSRERAQREPVAHQLDPSRAGDVPQHLVLVDRQIRWPNEVRFVSSQRGVEVRDSLPVKRESVDAYHCVTFGARCRPSGLARAPGHLGRKIMRLSSGGSGQRIPISAGDYP